MSVVLLGVTGSVAAYRAADLARDLMRAGHEVRVCLTRAAAEFVTPALFEALTGQPCLVDVFEEPIPGRMAHIDWARQADVVLIAPATADILNRLAAGTADDMLSTICLATEQPMVVAPAMNPAMYAHPATQAALETLRGRGAVVVEPVEGDVACGENGQGKLAANGAIADVVARVLRRSNCLQGKHVLITSGPTHEPIDDVRYIANRSSGRMGASLAQAALLMGARVTVVSGPTSVMLPFSADVKRVQTAVEMEREVLAVAPSADFVIGAAAVADFRVANPTPGKIRRGAEGLTVELIPNPDVIKAAAMACPGRVIAFAAEPSRDLAEAQAKLQRKGVFAIAHNDVSDPGIGFGSSENELTLIFADGREERSGRQSKLGCALWLLELVAVTNA